VLIVEGATMHTRHCLLVLALTLGSAAALRAQDAGQVGLTIAYPASVGVIVHVSDQIAIRPDITFSESTNDTAGSSNTVTSVGVSGLFYVQRWDSLRAYLSPRFGYQRSSAGVAAGTINFAPLVTGYSWTGSFGVQYLLHRRLAAFGETGLGYTHSSATTAAPLPTGATIDSTTHGWATRAGVGLIFYF
jgi:hypothetical protein